MNFSTEQAATILSPGNREEWWAPVPLQENAEPPAWVKDVDTQYLVGPAAKKYSNRPGFVFLLKDSPWEEFFESRDGYYIAQSGDGRAVCHYHGPLSQVMLTRSHNRGEELTWATQQDDGYAGRWFEVKMKDGREVVLRGPWHGGPPPGYVDITYHKWPEPYRLSNGVPGEKAWRRSPGYFGIYLSEDVIIQSVSHFLPHLRLARVQRYYTFGLEPYLDGEAPKGMTRGQMHV